MHFQGEKCTLSFGMHFTAGQVLLTGSVWFRRDASDNSDRAAPVARQLSVVERGPARPDRIPFQVAFTETEFDELRQWLASDAPSPFQLPAPLHHLRRIGLSSPGVNTLELELTHQELPAWWNWDIVFPLTVRLTIRPPEFAYLTETLTREYWSTDLVW